MASIRYYLHIPTGLIAGSGSFDGRGRGDFDPAFYDDLGLGNPNVQLNYKLKPEFKTLTVVSSPPTAKRCTFCPYEVIETDPAYIKWKENKDDLEERSQTEPDFYNSWLAEQESLKTYEQHASEGLELIQQLEQLQNGRSVCDEQGNPDLRSQCQQIHAEREEILLQQIEEKALLAEEASFGDPEPLPEPIPEPIITIPSPITNPDPIFTNFPIPDPVIINHPDPEPISENTNISNNNSNIGLALLGLMVLSG